MTIEEGLEQMGYEIRRVSPNWRLKEEEMPITDADRERESEHNRQQMIREADFDWMYRKRLQAIKDKGDSLDSEEKKLKEKHHEWFSE